MAYQSYSNAKVTLNGHSFFAQRAGVASQATLSPNYLAEERSSFSSIAQEGVRGSLSISYFLTGSDPLKPYTVDEKSQISGNLGGMYFNSGYLTSLSFTAAPFKPVLIEAQLDFFGSLSGEFSPTKEKLSENKILTFTDIKVNESGIEKDKLKSIQYGFSSQLTPVYEAGDTVPCEVRYAKKDINVNIDTYAISGQLNYAGDTALVKLSINNATGVAETYSVLGPLKSRKVTATAGERMSSSLSISQSFIGEAPTIGALSTSGNAMVINGTGHEWFHMEGTNLKTITDLKVGSTDVRDFTVLPTSSTDPDKISGVIASETHAGSHFITLSTYGGRIASSSPLITVGESSL